MFEFIGCRIEPVESLAIGAYPYISGIALLMQTEHCRIAQTTAQTDMTVFVTFHSAPAHSYQSFPDASHPDVVILVCIYAFDGMGRQRRRIACNVRETGDDIGFRVNDVYSSAIGSGPDG